MRPMRGASRYREERRRYSITCTSSVSPAANDLNDRPRRLFGSDHALDLRKSPIFTKLQWSPVIHAPTSGSLNWSRHLSYQSYMRRYPNTLQRYSNRQTPYYDETLDGLLILHLRRGDFDQHCWNFIEHSCGYNGYNSFDELPDRFSIPSGKSKEESADLYLKHCFPNVAQIVDRVKDVKKKVGGLRKIYIVTNRKGSWLAELRAALLKVR
jgi:hypothetical protein